MWEDGSIRIYWLRGSLLEEAVVRVMAGRRRALLRTRQRYRRVRLESRAQEASAWA